MRHTLIARTFPLLLAAISIVCGSLIAQEPSAPSVAEAAKRAREQKQNAQKPTKVITDDTLHPQTANSTETGGVSQPNPSTATPDASGTTANTPAAQAGSASAPDKDEENEKKKALESLKREIAEKQADVDLSQRELALANDSYYSKPDFSNDKDGKAKLDGMQSDLNAKKDDLTKLKAKFADLGGVEEVKPPAPPAPLVPARP